jgi:hypothetical protein
MADIGRVGWRKPGSLMPWPGSLTATARFHWPAILSSVAPARSGVRRSDSVRANRQVRIWPSAVSRTRSQVPQNDDRDEAHRWLRGQVPLGRIGAPDEVSWWIALLLSPSLPS